MSRRPRSARQRAAKPTAAAPAVGRSNSHQVSSATIRAAHSPTMSGCVTPHTGPTRPRRTNHRHHGQGGSGKTEGEEETGIVSLVSLSLLSFERYSVVLCRTHTTSNASQYRRASFAIAASWLYSLVWTLPPLLGWSSYGPEGPGTTCSIQWHQRSATARSYISCLFIFCLLLPLLLMFFCYGRILLAVRAVGRQITMINRSSAERREGRVLLMVVSMVTGYLLCWMPYGVVAMLASFGRPGMVPPAASLIPSLLAKTSTVLNPVIYVLLNKQFSRCLLYMIRCSSEDPPTPVHHTLPSSRGAWCHVFPPPKGEQNMPTMLTSRDQGLQQPDMALVAQYSTERSKVTS